jgi:hypothetical protein
MAEVNEELYKKIKMLQVGEEISFKKSELSAYQGTRIYIQKNSDRRYVINCTTLKRYR